jgi:hypothetical protein
MAACASLVLDPSPGFRYRQQAAANVALPPPDDIIHGMELFREMHDEMHRRLEQARRRQHALIPDPGTRVAIFMAIVIAIAFLLGIVAAIDFPPCGERPHGPQSEPRTVGSRAGQHPAVSQPAN